jgi:hypothetical protein
MKMNGFGPAHCTQLPGLIGRERICPNAIFLRKLKDCESRVVNEKDIDDQKYTLVSLERFVSHDVVYV